MKTITSEIAKKYLNAERQIVKIFRTTPIENGQVSVDENRLKPLDAILRTFHACEAMEDDAAEVLASFKEGQRWSSPSLDLPSLRSLTDRAATNLSKCSAGLHLDSLEALSETSACALATHRGPILSLQGLQSASEASLICLSSHKRVELSIPTITPRAAEVLGRSGHVITLTAILELTPELAAALGHCREFLGLGSLKSEHGLLNVLKCRPQGCWTDLSGLEAVSDELAAAISKTRCWVRLNGKVSMSLNAANSLLTSENSEVYRHVNAVRSAARNLKKKSIFKSISPGCPIEAYNWISPSLVAVKADAKAVRKAIKYEKKFLVGQQRITGLTVLGESSPEGGGWTIIECPFFEDVAIKVSRILKTQSVHLFYDPTSGSKGCQFFAAGRLLEELILDEESDEISFNDSLDRKFKTLGIGIPPCRP
jgi:hypothetical protein